MDRSATYRRTVALPSTCAALDCAAIYIDGRRQPAIVGEHRIARLPTQQWCDRRDRQQGHRHPATLRCSRTTQGEPSRTEPHDEGHRVRHGADEGVRTIFGLPPRVRYRHSTFLPPAPDNLTCPARAVFPHPPSSGNPTPSLGRLIQDGSPGTTASGPSLMGIVPFFCPCAAT